MPGSPKPRSASGSDLGRAYRVLARLRMRQLHLAQKGRIIESARYASRARRLGNFLDEKRRG